MHKNWCGKPCSECKSPCELDESIPCSPDCIFLGENGETSHPKCQECDALPLFKVPVCFDGAIYVRANSSEEARERIFSIKLCAGAIGNYNINEGEEVVE